MPCLRPRPLRGRLDSIAQHYGRSALGSPLLWFPAPLATEHSGLILAGTHGDESVTLITLSCAMRTLQDQQRRHHVVLAVNPDGCQLGLRANANGVDLNRNFPAANWQSGETVYRWNSQTEQRDVLLSSGSHASSEAETRALCQLIGEISPRWVVSFHEPLACIDDPDSSALGHWLAHKTQLPLVSGVGYATPGSFGSWCADQRLPCITAEFPPLGVDTASERYLAMMVELLCWQG